MVITTRNVLATALSITLTMSTRGQGNDNCSMAVPQSLDLGASITLSGDNSGAGGTGDFVVGSPYAGSPVYWVKFTTTECANITLSYCGQNPFWANTFGILAGTCPADELVSASALNDVDCGDGNRTYFFDNLPAGTWGVAVLNDPGNNSSGPFNLTVSASPCAENNDFCSDVTPVPLASGASLTFSGDNSAATGINDFDPGSPYAGAPVNWHAFTTTGCNNVTVSYCGQAPVWGNVFGILATDCPASNLVSASDLNTTDCGDGNTTFIYSALPEGTYYLPVVNDPGNNASGPYDVEVAAEACVENNDLCAEVFAQPLASGSSIVFTADNSSATGTNDFDPGSPYNGAPVFWHAFTIDGCNTVTVSYCGQDPAWTNVFGILARDCPALDLVSASQLNTTDCGDGNTTFIYENLAGGTYYLPVLADGNSGSIGAYTITVAAEACPQNNDFCDQVDSEPLVMGGMLTFSGDNTTASGTGDFVPGNPYDGAPIYWHLFTTTECADISVSYCGQNPVWGNTFGWLAIDCPADSLVLFTTFNDDTCGDGNRTYYWDELPAGTYAVPVVLDPGNNAVGPYSIQVEANECMSTGLIGSTAPQWSLYPNPTEGKVSLSVDRSLGTVRVDVIGATGRLVATERLVLNAGGTHELRSAEGLRPGVYAVRITSDLGTRTRSLVVR